MTILRRGSPMSLPIVNGRAPARPPLMVERTGTDATGSPSDVARALQALEQDLVRAQDDLTSFWAHSLDFLLAAATDAFLGGDPTKISAPDFSAADGRRKPKMGGHRLPPKPLNIRRIAPKPDPVSGAEVVEAVEQLRANLHLQMKQSAAADQQRTQQMAEIMRETFGAQ